MPPVKVYYDCGFFKVLAFGENTDLAYFYRKRHSAINSRYGGFVPDGERLELFPLSVRAIYFCLDNRPHTCML
jgi:hypothetical protein